MASEHAQIDLNGFRVAIDPSQFSAFVRDIPSPNDLEVLRADAADQWVLWPNRGLLYGLPRVAGAVLDGSVEKTLDVHDHLGFVAFLINNALPASLPYYKAFRNRPFTFLGRKREFVGEIQRSLTGTPKIMEQFMIRPRYVLEAKVVAPGEDAFIGLFVILSTRYDIAADLHELAEAGVNLAGLDVVRRVPVAGQRRLVGRIERLVGGEVVLAESFDQMSRIPVGDVAVEGSRDAFATCLRTILGERYGAFETLRARLEGELLGGPGIESMLGDMGKFLMGASPIAWARACDARSGSG